MVERLARASEKKDLLVLNFGLHFSETYKQELEQLVQQVFVASLRQYLQILFHVPLTDCRCDS